MAGNRRERRATLHFLQQAERALLHFVELGFVLGRQEYLGNLILRACRIRGDALLRFSNLLFGDANPRTVEARDQTVPGNIRFDLRAQRRRRNARGLGP